jgi:hypothetical protein
LPSPLSTDRMVFGWKSAQRNRSLDRWFS